MNGNIQDIGYCIYKGTPLVATVMTASIFCPGQYVWSDSKDYQKIRQVNTRKDAVITFRSCLQRSSTIGFLMICTPPAQSYLISISSNARLMITISSEMKTWQTHFSANVLRLVNHRMADQVLEHTIRSLNFSFSHHVVFSIIIERRKNETFWFTEGFFWFLIFAPRIYPCLLVEIHYRKERFSMAKILLAISDQGLLSLYHHSHHMIGLLIFGRIGLLRAGASHGDSPTWRRTMTSSFGSSIQVLWPWWFLHRSVMWLMRLPRNAYSVISSTDHGQHPCKEQALSEDSLNTISPADHGYDKGLLL